jgi:hypothetical protein
MTSGLDSLTVELSAADAAILKRVQYELDRAHVKARFAAEPMDAGTKAAADLVPLLIVVVAGLTEACKLVGILIEARTRQKPVIEVSVKNGDQHFKLTNAAPDDLRMIIEGHYRDSDGGA